MKLFTDFLQSAAAAIVEAKAELEHFALAIRQAVQNILHLLLEQLVARRLGWSQRGMIFQEVTQVAIVLFANRRLQTHRLLAHLNDLPHLLRDLLGRGFAPQVLQETAADADQPVDSLNHMHRNTNSARLISDSARDGLANPPGRIGAELVPFGVVELFDSADQTDIPLLDQVQQVHAASNVLLSHADHEAEVGLRQTALGLLAFINVPAIWRYLQALGS